MFISVVLVFHFFLSRRLFRPSTEVLFSSSSAAIRFSTSSCQHLVPAVHPCCQLGQACVFSALHDGCTGPRSLERFSEPFHARALSRRIRFYDVPYFFRIPKSHDAMIAVFSFPRLAFTGSMFQNRAIRTLSSDLDFSLAKYALTPGVVP